MHPIVQNKRIIILCDQILESIYQRHTVSKIYCATSMYITSMTWAVLNLKRCVERYDFCR